MSTLLNPDTQLHNTGKRKVNMMQRKLPFQLRKSTAESCQDFFIVVTLSNCSIVEDVIHCASSEPER